MKQYEITVKLKKEICKLKIESMELYLTNLTANERTY